MLVPNTFAIHVTYTCPLSCAHCCFSSNPANKEKLPIELILQTIRVLDQSTIQMVAFTGGEPLLLGDNLVAAVREASSQGFVTRVVTSAYWGKNLSVARKKLEQLKEAGLQEISISWDDFHEEFITFECVYNVFWTAIELGILPAINVVQAGNSHWNSERVRNELGLGELGKNLVVETPLNLNGRAESQLKDAGLRPSRTIGPCPYVLLGPTLSAKNKLLACCGVIPDTDALVLDPEFKPENLKTAVENGLKSPLLNWIYLRGPYAVMEYISKRYEIPIPEKERIGGNCEACKILFETEALAEKIPDAVAEKEDEVFGEIKLLDMLGFLEPKTILNLWQSDSTVMEVAPRKGSTSHIQKIPEKPNT